MFIPDDVITAAISLLRNQDTNDLFTFGDFTPAAQQIDLKNPTQQYFLDDDKIAINFLLIQQHWMTVIFDPMTRNIHLFDSKRNNNRPRQVLPLLRQMYGNRIVLSDIIYPTVVQQPFDDPSCGAFAIAFASSYIVGKQPENEKYIARKMRHHLKNSILSKIVLPFPTEAYQPTIESFTREKTRLRKQKSRSTQTNKLEELERRRQARTDPVQIQKEVDYKRKSRSNPVVKQQELETRRELRQNPAVKQQERDAKSESRKDPSVKQQEAEAKRKSRESPFVKQQEAYAKRKSRESPLVKQQEADAKRKARENPLVKQQQADAN